MACYLQRMSTQDPDLAEVIEAALDIHQERIYTMLPGRVEAYDKDSHTADVQPLSANVYEGEDGEKVAERLPVHPSVPVVFPSGGGYRLVFPIAAGDTVMLVYASRSMSEIITSSEGAEVVPADGRRNHLSDPVAIPGFRVGPFKYVPDNVMSIGSDDGDAVIDIDTDATEVRAGKGATEAVVVQSALDNFMTALSNAIADTDPVVPGPHPNSSTNACLKTLQTFLLALPGVPPAVGVGWKAGTTIAKAK